MPKNKIDVPVTNIGFEILLGAYNVMPTVEDFLGDIKSADGVEYQVEKIKYAPVNMGGYANEVPTLKVGQATTIEIYMNNNYVKLHDKFHNNDVSSSEFYCSLALKYPKNERNSEVPDYWYNGFISKIKSSGGTEAEAQYFTIEFTPTSAPMKMETTDAGEEE